jgi:hypothetical protein
VGRGVGGARVRALIRKRGRTGDCLMKLAEMEGDGMVRTHHDVDVGRKMTTEALLTAIGRVNRLAE